MSTARCRAFKACPETCPRVNSAANKLELTIKQMSDIAEEFENYRETEAQARDRLREALVAAYDLLEAAEEEVKDLKNQLARVDA